MFMNYDYIKYGIGIGTKTKEVGFGDLVFAPGLNVSVSQGSVHMLNKNVYQDYILQAGTEYVSNPIFAYITEHSIDNYIVRIPKEATGIVELYINQIVDNALGYVLVIIEAGADVTIRELRTNKNVQGVIVDVVVEAQANCRYIIENTASKKSYTFGVHTAKVLRDASISWFDWNRGGNITKHSIVTHLVEPGAHANTYGVFLGSDEQVYDLYTATEHIASHTTSDMFIRGVLDDNSKAVYRGLVKVHSGAAGCQGYQQEDTLLLSDQASVSSVPDLEILNSDVTCSHGVTTTHIDDLKLFYARSRGMSRTDAEQQFVMGHVGAVIEKLPFELQEQYIALCKAVL
jgi:Fe-S cluster assembly protein SufD